MSGETGRAMPRYRCHKEVWALKIARIGGEQGFTIYPADEGYAPFDLPAEYFMKHAPQIGGYYVVYKDGYRSFSPAEAFEDGYTLID